MIFLKKVKEKFTELKLPLGVQAFFNPPNTKLSIITKKRLTDKMCDDIQKILQLKDDLTAMDIQTRSKHSRYSKTVRVDDSKQFKARVSECGAEYPNIAFFADHISFKRRILPWAGPIIGGFAYAIGKHLVDLFLIN